MVRIALRVYSWPVRFYTKNHSITLANWQCTASVLGTQSPYLNLCKIVCELIDQQPFEISCKYLGYLEMVHP